MVSKRVLVQFKGASRLIGRISPLKTSCHRWDRLKLVKIQSGMSVNETTGLRAFYIT